jgi:hypothetical protein
MFAMNEPTAPITVALRIPGQCARPCELIECLPDGYRLTAKSLIMPDSTPIEFGALAADKQFAQIFRSSSRQPAAEDELAIVGGPARLWCDPAARACSLTTVRSLTADDTGRR